MYTMFKTDLPFLGRLNCLSLCVTSFMYNGMCMYNGLLIPCKHAKNTCKHRPKEYWWLLDHLQPHISCRLSQTCFSYFGPFSKGVYKIDRCAAPLKETLPESIFTASVSLKNLSLWLGIKFQLQCFFLKYLHIYELIHECLFKLFVCTL